MLNCRRFISRIVINHHHVSCITQKHRTLLKSSSPILNVFRRSFASSNDDNGKSVEDILSELHDDDPQQQPLKPDYVYTPDKDGDDDGGGGGGGGGSSDGYGSDGFLKEMSAEEKTKAWKEIKEKFDLLNESGSFGAPKMDMPEEELKRVQGIMGDILHNKAKEESWKDLFDTMITPEMGKQMQMMGFTRVEFEKDVKSILMDRNRPVEKVRKDYRKLAKYFEMPKGETSTPVTELAQTLKKHFAPNADKNIGGEDPKELKARLMKEMGPQPKDENDLFGALMSHGEIGRDKPRDENDPFKDMPMEMKDTNMYMDMMREYAKNETDDRNLSSVDMQKKLLDETDTPWTDNSAIEKYKEMFEKQGRPFPDDEKEVEHREITHEQIRKMWPLIESGQIDHRPRQTKTYKRLRRIESAMAAQDDLSRKSLNSRTVLAKQLLRHLYGITETKTLKKHWRRARTYKRGNQINYLVAALERRLVVVLFRMKLAPNVIIAKRMIKHKMVYVNDKLCIHTEYPCREGDRISVDYHRAYIIPYLDMYLRKLSGAAFDPPHEESPNNVDIFQHADGHQYAQGVSHARHVQVDFNILAGVFLYAPGLDDIRLPRNTSYGRHHEGMRRVFEIVFSRLKFAA